MLYDSNGFKLYIYIYSVFQNLFMCHTYIYSIGPMPKSVEYHFWAVFEVFRTVEAVFIGHVRLRARTCPGLRFPAYIRELSAPLEP
jgi:hypothetical protein